MRFIKRVLIATSNPGKLEDFRGAAGVHGVDLVPLLNLANIPEPSEDGDTFEANARTKAEYYSRFAAGQLVIADDSGLSVDALGGAPGVRSARYASPHGHSNSPDEANNRRLLSEMRGLSAEERRAHFICVIAAARDGHTLATFQGVADGAILFDTRGSGGFGYDPLFYCPALSKTFAELTAEEKAGVSHRGAAFRKFLAWFEKTASGGADQDVIQHR